MTELEEVQNEGEITYIKTMSAFDCDCRCPYKFHEKGGKIH